MQKSESVASNTSSIYVDSTKEAAGIVTKILFNTPDLNNSELENLCRDSLEAYCVLAPLVKFDQVKSSMRPKSIDSKVGDIFSTGLSSSLTPVQLKNQSLRFSIEDSSSSSQSKSSGWSMSSRLFSALSSSGNSSLPDSRDYEDVISNDILEAPICDVCIIQRGDPVPDGFYRISKTLTNRKANLNTGSGGNSMYLCIKKDLSKENVPITAIIVFFPDKNEFVPPTFFPVKRGKHACNLNSGTSTERIFLAYKKDKYGNPITDLQVIFPSKSEFQPRNFNLIDKSPSGIEANLNSGTNGLKTMLVYKQRLLRLDCLKNEPTMERWPLENAQTKHGSLRFKLPPRQRTISSPPMRSKSMTAFNRDDTPTNNEPNNAVSLLNSDSDVPDSSNVPQPGGAIVKSDSFDESQPAEEDTNSQVEAEFDDYADVEINSVNDLSLSLPQVPRENQFVLDSEGHIVPKNSRKALLVMLSALYTHSEVLSKISLSGLTNLLKDTDFFELDLKCVPHHGSVTMTDIVIESVCDHLDTCSISSHEPLLQFLRTLTRYLSGRLTSLSLQRVYRAIYFLVGYYSTRSSWMFVSPNLPTAEGPELTTLQYFKEFIVTNIAHLELVDVAQFLPVDPNEAVLNTCSELNGTSESIVKCILDEFIDDTIESIEISRIVDSVALLASKQTLTLSSAVFWDQIRVYGRRLFQDSSYRRVFTILCALCKSAWQTVRILPNSSDPNARDLGTKLIALDVLQEFCRVSGEKMKLSKVMGYVIRRLVVPCLLYNVHYALTDHRVFSKVLRIITSLWKVWRGHIRIEFAILCEYLMTKILQASQLAIKPVFQLIVLQEVVTWFDQPSLILEMFVNYDLDSRFVSHWNVFSYLIRAVCTIARRTSSAISAWNWRQNGNSLNDNSNIGVSFRDVHLCALEEVASISKTLMDATGHAFLIQQDSEFRSRTLGNGLGWEEDFNDPATPRRPVFRPITVESSDDSKDNSSSSTPTTTPPMQGKFKRQSTVRTRRNAHQESEKLIQEAMEIYRQKDSIKKAVEYLVSKQFMPNTPQEIASFLRVYKNHFDPTAIGDFLGEGGITPEQIEYWSQIRFRYIRAVSFIDEDLEPALRTLLTECGFRLPGEAQKIDRMVEVFVKIFWQDNHGTIYCPFSHPDTVHLVTYAMIMLNTDLHRANRDKRKKMKKMTKEEFLSNLRGADKGADIDSEYLSRIYENIKDRPIELPYGDTETNHVTALQAMLSANKSRNVGSPSTSGVLRLGNKPNMNSNIVQNTNNNTLIDPDEATGIGATGMINKPQEFGKVDEKTFNRDLLRGLRDAEDLLRTLSPYTYHFQFTGVDTNISLDLVSFMYDTVWFHFHAITDALLVETQTGNDITITFSALDILSQSLTSSIFLGLKVEKMTFATQLMEFRELCEPKANQIVSRQLSDDDFWYRDVESVTPSTALETVSKILKLIVLIKDAMQESNNFELTRTVANKIEKRAKVLENNRFFVRESDLIKRNRGGRLTTYRFFLFSDHLIYAHQAMSGEYRVHEQLALVLMTVSDVDTDPTGCSFYINHPTKSFMVIAETHVLKAGWLHDLDLAILSCKRRDQGQGQGPLHRRMSIISRIHDQQEEQNKRQEVRKVLSSRSPEKALPSPGKYNGKTPHKLEVQGQSQPGFLHDDNSEVPDDRVFSPLSYDDEDAYDSDQELVIDTTLPPELEAQLSPAATVTNIDRIAQFKSIVESLDDRTLNGLFERGVDFWKGTLESRLGRGGGSLASDDDIKAHLYGLYHQGTYGNYNQEHIVSVVESLAVTAPVQLRAWKECTRAGMSPLEARKQFLLTMFEVVPYWKYSQFL